MNESQELIRHSWISEDDSGDHHFFRSGYIRNEEDYAFWKQERMSNEADKLYQWLKYYLKIVEIHHIVEGKFLITGMKNGCSYVIVFPYGINIYIAKDHRDIAMLFKLTWVS